MPVLSLRHLTALGAVCLAGLLAGSTAQAAPAGARTASPYAASVQGLRATVLLLEEADHDYDGHRANAIHHIHQAMHAMAPAKHAGSRAKHTAGVVAKRKPAAQAKRAAQAKPVGGNETQAVSDTQLQQALAQVLVIRNQLAGANTPQAVAAMNHLGLAVTELQTALKIR